jgi:hypothetical protein
MSNELNITETFYGTIDPGVALEFFDWSGNYDDVRKKARFFTVAPDPWLPLGGFDFEVAPIQLNLELTATWCTVWVDADGNATFQRNARIANIGDATAAFHLLRAETDN